MPLLSQCEPSVNFDQSTIDQLTNRIQFGGDEVVKAKDGAGSATLSMAFAGARFAASVLEAASGKASKVQEYTYVDLDSEAGGKEVASKIGAGSLQYFSVPVTLGPNGVEKIHGLGKMSDYEEGLVKKAVADLAGNIEKGQSFVAKSSNL